jgi:translation initiation factor 1
VAKSKRDEPSKPTTRVDLPQGEVRLVHNPFAAHFGRGDAARLEEGPRSEPAEEAPRAPTRLVVRRERAGRGGKGVTIVEGEPLRGRDLQALAKDLARAMGAGARVESGALVLQGEQVERVVAWLSARGFGPVVAGN